VPCHAKLGIGAFVDALITSIIILIHVLPVQQAAAFDHTVNIARCASHRVHQARLSVRANVGINAKVPLVTFLLECISGYRTTSPHQSVPSIYTQHRTS
jgi:hypothetical protein